MTITALPTPPSTDDPTNFDSRADTFLAALSTFVTEANALEADLNNLVTAAFTTTSTTSLTVGTGTKTLTVQAGLGYAIGQTAIIARTSDAANLMVGKVSSYNATSGALSVSVPPGGAYGSGTYTDWTVSLGPAGNAPVVRGHLAGLALSTAGSSATFSVAAGECADSTNAVTIPQAAALSKTTSAWAVGSGNGGLDTGAIANSTWYHAYLIYNPTTGVTDALVSTSASSPTLPSGYTYFRRIGSMKTDGSGKWTAFVQLGDLFLWSTAVRDVNSVTPTSGAVNTVSLSVPPGVNVVAKLNAQASWTSGTLSAVWVYSRLLAAAPVLGNVLSNSGFVDAPVDVVTDTSAQVSTKMTYGGATPYSIETWGWIDRRGRDD